jgi:hypothetical protein
MKDNDKVEYKPSVSAIGSIFLALLIFMFLSIVYMVAFIVCDIQASENFLPTFLFMIVNSLVIIIVIGFGKTLSKIMAIASYISIATITVLYTLILYIFIFATYNIISVKYYSLFHILILFIYFLLVLPTALSGINHKNNNI